MNNGFGNGCSGIKYFDIEIWIIELPVLPSRPTFRWYKKIGATVYLLVNYSYKCHIVNGPNQLIDWNHITIILFINIIIVHKRISAYYLQDGIIIQAVE